MKEGECGGKARHPAVVAADMQPREDMTFGDEVTDYRCLVALRRAVQGDRPRPFGQRAGEVAERCHAGLLNERRRRVTSWLCSGGGVARPPAIRATCERAAAGPTERGATVGRWAPTPC